MERALGNVAPRIEGAAFDCGPPRCGARRRV